MLVPTMSLPLVALLGPTASGKTNLSLELAKADQGEIISADARQIYVGMDIGTDKPGFRERGVGNGTTSSHAPPTLPHHPLEPQLIWGAPHYLIDILTPDTSYSASAFRNDALSVLRAIHERGHLPIVVGGTGLYVRALTEGLTLGGPPDPAFRRDAETRSLADLLAELERQAPAAARRIDRHNRRRIIRALEIARAGRTARRKRPSPLRTLKLALHVDREELKRRIIERVERQLNAGLVDEVRVIVARYGPDAPGLQAIGYRDVFPLLRGEATREETRERVIRATWQYARRQMTWLRREPRVVWVNSQEDALKKSEDWLRKNTKIEPSDPS